MLSLHVLEAFQLQGNPLKTGLSAALDLSL